MNPQSSKNPEIRLRAYGTCGSDRHGFALVVTLSIMVLLAVLIVGLLALSSVSIRSASNNLAIAEARANARFGLAIAIGELQKQMGPDQRISAPAGLRNESLGSRANWLGVYRSWLDTVDERPEPEFLAWLVSGNKQLLGSESTVGGASIASRMVTLVGEGNLTNSQGTAEPIEAGLVDIDSKSGMAWWIGDESTKARIPGSAVAPASVVEARANLMTAPQAGIERLPSLGGISRQDAALDKVVSTSTLGLLSSDPKLSHFNDLTCESVSLVSNVRKGGFLRDLSMELEKNERRRPTEALYMVDGQSGKKKKGITIGELWDYYNLWKELEYPSRGLSHPDGGKLPGGFPTLKSKTDHREAVQDPFYPYRRITVLRNTWVVSLMSLKENSTSNSHQLYVVLDPILTVWNPFDVAIQIDPKAYTGFKYWGIPYRWDLRVGTSTTARNINEIIGGNFIMSTLYGRAEPIVLRPGEVQVISQGSTEKTTLGKTSMLTDLRLGWNFGSGFRFKVPVPTSSPAAPLTWNMNPSPNGHMGVALVEFLQYQGTPAGTFEANSVWTGGLMVDRNLEIGDRALQATDSPKIFPAFNSRGRRLSVGSIEGSKEPMFLISLDMKTENDPIDEGNFQGRFHLRHNPKLSAYDIQSFDPATLATMPMQISVKPLNSWKDPILDVGASGLGYAGGDYTALFGNSQIVTHSIPREPIYSLAAFQNAVANGEPYQFFADHRTIEHHFLYPSVSHSVGNSFAPSFLEPNQTTGTLNASVAADHSYLANKALWDDWFFSSIAPQVSRSWTEAGSPRDQRTVFEQFLGLDGTEAKALPNRHMQPWVKYKQALVDSVFSGVIPRPEATDRIAANLMIEGGFNVNSTSVPAWTALFSSLRQSQVPMLDALDPGPEKLETAQGVPSGALLTAGGTAIPDRELDDAKTSLQWRGFRDLDDYQIEELAEAMVKQVRKRGPFLSRADFVNRRVGSDKELAASGALQAALDDKSVSINQDYLKGSRAVSMAEASAAGLVFPEAEAGAAAAGIPGYVKQADLLTSIGPLLTVRGDTFRIRAYGESRSAGGGTVLARAWCEAVVQRIPDYMDPSEPAWDRADELNKPLNQQFGRRFQVTRFRWLQPQDI
jgi:hypothetical protein